MKEFRILLADDLVQFLDLEKSFLRRAECTLLTATDGAQALKIAKENHPNLLLLDIEMPKLTGIEVCRILRQDPEFRTVPIVMVTANEKRREEAMQAGATDFWVKPIREESFLAGIQRLIPIRIRKDPRIHIGIPVKIQRDLEMYDGITRDLSLGGAFILTNYRSSLSEKIPILFEPFSGEKLSTYGVVVRMEESPDRGIGVEFVWEDLSVRKKWEEWVKKWSKEEG
jgi:CheY-like chemotaxis protein